MNNQTQVAQVPVEVSRQLARLADEAIRCSPEVQRTQPGTHERLQAVYHYIRRTWPASAEYFTAWIQSLRRDCGLPAAPPAILVA